MKKIAFIVQRYGYEISGGSEFLCKQLAERLSKYFVIEILTTCAIDYITWKNEYQEGDETVNDILVRRFPVNKTRNLKKFQKRTIQIINKKNNPEEEYQWIEEQGPYVPKILDYIANNKNNYSLFVFFTYRYYQSIFGLPLVSDKSILVPTAENEPTLNLSVITPFFSLPRGFVFLTPEEQEMINNSFNIKGKIQDVIGLGVNIPDNVDELSFKIKYNLTHDFILYVGRIALNKGCDILFEYFINYKEKHNSELKLVLIGDVTIKIPEKSDIIHLGFLSEEEKFEGIKAAKILVMPSEYESYSIVVTEAMAMGTPVLVNEKCAVLKGHCIRSNAGLFFSNYDEFSDCLDLLINCPKLRQKFGVNGKKYIMVNYDWSIIESKYLDVINKIIE